MSFETMRASDIMTREVLTIPGNASLRSAARMMREHHVHCLIVPADRPNRCAGVLTTKDIVQVLCEAEPSTLDELRVSDVMTAPAVAVQQDFTVQDCILLMRRCGVRSAPVLDGARIVGLLSFTDVVKVAAG
jgi:CBS domain-containing protein